MITHDDIQKIDKKHMYEIYDNWNILAAENLASPIDKVDLKNIDHIVFAGMGGSGTIGDVISSILSKTKMHSTVTKGYLLPKNIDENTLVVATSISGNTEETLSIAKSSLKLNAKFVSFSSGGLLEKFCNSNNLINYSIRINHSPRASFIGYIFSILNALEEVMPITKSEKNESISKLNDLQKLINTKNLSNTNPSLNLAYWIKNIPIVYYPWGLQSAAIRFKNSLQENSKNHILIEDIIEASHNGIVAWEKNSNVQPILLQGHDDNIKTIERWKIIKKVFDEKNIDYHEVFSGNGNILSKLVCLIYMFDFSSIYHSVINGIDPSPVNPIDFIKSHLSFDTI